MRKLLIIATILVPMSAHADLNSEMDLMDMQDDFELRQMGLDYNSMQMRQMQEELAQLRAQLNDSSAPSYPVKEPPSFDPKTSVPTGEPFFFPPTKR